MKEVKPRPDRYREIMDKLFTQHTMTFQPRPSYDGRKNMYSSRKINDGEVG